MMKTPATNVLIEPSIKPAGYKMTREKHGATGHVRQKSKVAFYASHSHLWCSECRDESGRGKPK